MARGRSWRAGVVGGLVVLLLAAACRQLVGIDDAPPTDLGAMEAGLEGGLEGGADAGACGIAYSGGCGACVTANCCTQAKACSGEPACDAYASCLAGCAGGDEACRARCALDHPPGSSATTAELEACLAGPCAAPSKCDLSCGSIVAVLAPPDDAATACATCVSGSSACGSALLCQQSVDCIELAQCFLACGPGFDCHEACNDQHEAGVALFDLFANAFTASCATPCASGDDWTCVGHVTPPTALYSETTVTLDLAIFGESTPVQGLQVSACPADPPGCPSPLDTETSDDGGHVTVTVGQIVNSLGFTGHYEITSPDGGYQPEVFYLSFPLRESHVEVGVQTMLYSGALQALLQGFDIPEGDGGALALVAYDCVNIKSPRVQFSTSLGADAGLRTLYLFQNSLSTTVTQTDLSGAALIANVPAGPVEVYATPVGLTQPSSHLPVNVEPGKITVVYLFPD